MKLKKMSLVVIDNEAGRRRVEYEGHDQLPSS